MTAIWIHQVTGEMRVGSIIAQDYPGCWAFLRGMVGTMCDANNWDFWSYV